MTEDDIATADRLCAQVLGRDLDEVPPRTRALLVHIRRLVDSECQRLGMKASDYRFTRRQVREHSVFGHTQLKVHLRRLTHPARAQPRQPGRDPAETTGQALDANAQTTDNT